MSTRESKPRSQRSKSGMKKWPKWLRSPRLLKWTFRIMVVVYPIMVVVIRIVMAVFRIWRWWGPDG